MLGCRSGFQTMVKEKFTNATGTHCTLRRQALTVKTMPDHLKNVLNDVVKAVSFLKANSLNLRLFTYLCKDNGSEFETFLLYSGVRWLSKRRVLKRVFVLRKEIHEFLPLQGKDITVFHCHEKMTAFKMKLHLWHSKLKCENFAPFPNLNTFLDEDGLRHVLILHAEIQRYFSDLQNFEKVHHFITNPFEISVVDLPSEDYVIKEQFIDLLNDGDAKDAFRNMCFSEFWIEMTQSYPDVAKLALKFIVPFATTYKCETAFTTLLAIKTKVRNKLDVAHDMRVALSKTQPNIEDILQTIQVYPSH
uniref:HAT C-terminal dimerisation domain-containing protein n=1 Tax=Octopus bimaculoides TaxID=37653 RepID=A0A0L8I4U3_OCTBM